MAQFKRVKLFSNLTSLTADNIIYDEVWVYKLLSDTGAIKQKYRIRYQKTDSAMLAYGFSEEEAKAVDEMMSSYGPAISCTLDVWESEGWVRCLDWMGDPSASMSAACQEINEQFKSFITCVPLENSNPEYSSPESPKPPKPRKPKKDTTSWKYSEKIDVSDIKDKKPNDLPKGDPNPPDFEWI